ncbi:TPA: hypothetical protein DCY43_03705 [candidate division WWE3 bacterium]|uniref:DUF5673 domain-containing protein n=3 Tax=Katanobacteria TaxID=422282 RepID=A0A0G1MSA0_UNCKA|nr:MAG: hypothetical protein UW82_C0035G0003 [candidate division WWE3 bacterium GW2011_GWC2_44_9]OGC53196.1 MAG: hypothetical protein A2709_02535 [candidate division WWE3 bacterium RIFCSPHIGHO2_01_FULL_43_9]HAZ29816.1 hypothetical protein [candidate division WWE3 bacterium]
MQISDIASFVGLTKRKEEPAAVSSTEAAAIDPKNYGEKLIEFTWTANDRVIKEITPKAAKTIIIIAVSVSLLFALMQEFVLILVIASTGFLAYMLSKSPIIQVNHKVSTHGLLYAGTQFYYWHELTQFFFKQDGSNLLLCVDTVEKIPGRVFLSIKHEDREKLKELFGKRLIFREEEPKSFVDKAYGLALSKFDLK